MSCSPDKQHVVSTQMWFLAEQWVHRHHFYPHFVPPEQGRLNPDTFNDIVAWLYHKRNNYNYIAETYYMHFDGTSLAPEGHYVGRKKYHHGPRSDLAMSGLWPIIFLNPHVISGGTTVTGT